MISERSIVAVILAGGQSRRFGSIDKSLVGLAGRPLIAHVIARIAPQVSAMVVNASGDLTRFQPFGVRVIADEAHGTPATGPIVGLISAFRALRQSGDVTSLVLSLPVDTPFLPTDLVARLASALAGHAAAVSFAATTERDHPIVALWSPEIREATYAVFRQNPEISLHRMMERLRGKRVVFRGDLSADLFFNVNSPEDLREAERMMSRAD
jgi:molybdopterin-guanine dinucleotide biosynthesis protein A, proteobacterial